MWWRCSRESREPTVSRWKHLDDWPEKLQRMTVEELRKELAYWQMKADVIGRKARKGCLKMAWKVGKVLREKLAAEEESQDRA